NEPNVGPGPGPQRLPRPLTAADLHLQLEREQEAVVCFSRFLLSYNTSNSLLRSTVSPVNSHCSARTLIPIPFPLPTTPPHLQAQSQSQPHTQIRIVSALARQPLPPTFPLLPL